MRPRARRIARSSPAIPAAVDHFRAICRQSRTLPYMRSHRQRRCHTSRAERIEIAAREILRPERIIEEENVDPRARQFAEDACHAVRNGSRSGVVHLHSDCASSGAEIAPESQEGAVAIGEHFHRVTRRQ